MEIILISIHLTWKEVKTPYCTNRIFNPIKDEAQTVLFKDLVRTAL
jgi:hypothetical protein